MGSNRFLGRPQVVARLVKELADQRSGQSFLFAGPEGSGKEATALEIARLVNCVAVGDCHRDDPCESCRKSLTWQHPDIRWIGPAPATITDSAVTELLENKRAHPFYCAPFAASANVSIGDADRPGPLTVRSLIHFLRLQAFQGRYKVGIVGDCHRLTLSAANALLKTLEEPPPRTLLLLLTSNAAAIPSTIRSRCQQLRFEPYTASELVEIIGVTGDLTREEAQRYARLADGNARRAVALMEPQTVALYGWAEQIFGAIHAGEFGALHRAADLLHAGTVPAVADSDSGSRRDWGTRELAVKRERAILLCEVLILYYSDALACRERMQPWRPRCTEAAETIRMLAERRSSDTLLADIADLESVKEDIERNLNIGLTMAVLFQGLIDHAERDRSIVAEWPAAATPARPEPAG